MKSAMVEEVQGPRGQAQGAGGAVGHFLEKKAASIHRHEATNEEGRKESGQEGRKENRKKERKEKRPLRGGLSRQASAPLAFSRRRTERRLKRRGCAYPFIAFQAVRDPGSRQENASRKNNIRGDANAAQPESSSCGRTTIRHAPGSRFGAVRS